MRDSHLGISFLGKSTSIEKPNVVPRERRLPIERDMPGVNRAKPSAAEAETAAVLVTDVPIR
jgi:hypothetical protein